MKETPYAWVVVWATFVCLALIFGVSYSFAAFFESFAAEFSAQRADVSWIFGLSGFVYFVLGAGGGMLADRFGPRIVCSAGMALIALGLLATSWATSLLAVYVSYGLLVGLGMHTVQTAGLALATDLAPPERQPQVVGLMYVMQLIGMIGSALVLGYEFKLHGLVVDSIKNLAVGNYTPDVRSSASGHVVGLSTDENSLYKQTSPLNFLRVYYSALTDTIVCIDEIVATLNSNYEEVVGLVSGPCMHKVDIGTGIDDLTLNADNLSIVPNPNSGKFDLYLNNGILQGAEIKVTDALGQLVYSTTSNSTTNRASIELGNVQSGIYLLQLNLKGKQATKRVMVAGK